MGSLITTEIYLEELGGKEGKKKTKKKIGKKTGIMNKWLGKKKKISLEINLGTRKKRIERTVNFGRLLNTH